MNSAYYRNLENLRRKIDVYKNSSNSSIIKLLAKRKIFKKKETMKTILSPVASLKGWKSNKGNIYHKSNQFFSIEGVKIKDAKREVSEWDQPILNQPHGGILAFLVRETKEYGIEFLLCLRSEPGDENIKFCPSFSATQSNINRAHGGKRTELYEAIIKKKGTRLIAKTTHNEEGARFWRKKNQNLLVFLKNPDDKITKSENFVWANIWQIKKLCLEDCVINPFVKTILFMI